MPIESVHIGGWKGDGNQAPSNFGGSVQLESFGGSELFQDTSSSAEFDPNVIITSTDDPGQLLFDLAIRAPRARVVHLVRATIAVPFGPDSSFPSRSKTAALRRADGAVAVSEYVAAYTRQWGQMDAIHLPISLLEPGEFPCCGRFDNRFVTMVNPCAVKGTGKDTLLLIVCSSRWASPLTTNLDFRL